MLQEISIVLIFNKPPIITTLSFRKPFCVSRYTVRIVSNWEGIFACSFFKNERIVIKIYQNVLREIAIVLMSNRAPIITTICFRKPFCVYRYTRICIAWKWARILAHRFFKNKQILMKIYHIVLRKKAIVLM